MAHEPTPTRLFDSARICLVMIVRNEASIIHRCLSSVRPFIDYWVIADTGSEDNTAEIIREELAGIPGELHGLPWVDFGQTRTAAMKLAKGKGDYHLLLDADMTLRATTGCCAKLKADAFWIRFEGPLDYSVLRLVSDRHDWRYIGPTHEYICAETATRFEKLPGLSISHHEDGGGRKSKYERDIQLLKRALEEDPDNARYVFYLAQS